MKIDHGNNVHFHHAHDLRNPEMFSYVIPIFGYALGPQDIKVI